MEGGIENKKYNKGEWAELYVLLKLLGDGRLYTADQFLKKNLNIYLDVLKIIREDSKKVFEYKIKEDKSVVIIRKQCEEECLAEVPTSDFSECAQTLFDGIKKAKKSPLLAPDEVYDFIKIIYVTNPKAASVKSLKAQFGGKNDIYIELRDAQTAITALMGFSIKSKFGHNPTLFNAGTSSQFLYKLSGCGDDEMESFNNIMSTVEKGAWGYCRDYLVTNNIHLEFVGTQHQIYRDNLELIRGEMASILAWCAKDRLVDSYADDHGLIETVQRMVVSNPFGVNKPEIFYEKVIKDFLIAGFAGMTAGREWDGKEEVNGGYIAVLDDGDVICYHSSDRESFKNYLYRNTYFEYVDFDKYAWGRIFKENGEYYLPLNISVRFYKKTR